MLQVGDRVRFIDNYKLLKEKSLYNHREYYMKLAAPNKEYTVDAISVLNEVYLEGIAQYVNPNLLEKC